MSYNNNGSDKKEYIGFSYRRAGGSRIDMRIDVDSTLDDCLKAFEGFLRACTYYIDGEVQIVDQAAEEQAWSDARTEHEELEGRIAMLEERLQKRAKKEVTP